MSTTAERFWSKVGKSGEDACWPWLGTRSRAAIACRMLKNSRDGLTLVRITGEARELRDLVDEAIKLALDSGDHVMAEFLSTRKRRS